MNRAPLAELSGIGVRYRKGGDVRHGLIEIDLAVAAGETLAIIGESGCGKSTLGRVLLRLQEPTEGDVRYRGESLLALKPHAMRRRRQAMQMIFQDPLASLNPRMTVGETLGEPLMVHRLARRWRDTVEPVAAAMRRVGLDPATVRRFPHQFSGGQRQRIAIARATMAGAELIVADEPLASLDITIQSQILGLFEDMRAQGGVTFVFISHDLPVVSQTADRVVVMLGGRIVEDGAPRAVFREPAHPYTQALVDAVPVPDPDAARRRQERPAAAVAHGTPARPDLCPFAPRCPHLLPACTHTMPPLRHVAPGRRAACWLHGDWSPP
nr:ABC transporter ATP-binding protein [uncultured Lichenicoccus sp.]